MAAQVGERAVNLFEGLPDSLLLEVLHRVKDAESVMSVRQCCKKACALSGLVESLDLHLPELGDRAECRLVRIVKLTSKVKHLKLFVDHTDRPYLTTLCLLSILEHVRATLVSFEMHGAAYEDITSTYTLPLQALSELAKAENLSSLKFVSVDPPSKLTWDSAKAYPLKNLISLSMDTGFAEASILEVLLRLCPSLKSLRIDGFWVEQEEEWSFASVPKLKTLSLSVDPNCSWGQTRLPVGAGTVSMLPPAGLTHLDLVYYKSVFFSFSDIVRILFRTRSLESLCLQWQKDPTQAEADGIAALIVTSASLRHLETNSVMLLNSLAATLDRPLVGMLAGGPLPELKELVISVPVLAGGADKDLLRFFGSLEKLERLVLRPPCTATNHTAEEERCLGVAMDSILAVLRVLPKVQVCARYLANIDIWPKIWQEWP